MFIEQKSFSICRWFWWHTLGLLEQSCTYVEQQASKPPTRGRFAETARWMVCGMNEYALRCGRVVVFRRSSASGCTRTHSTLSTDHIASTYMLLDDDDDDDAIHSHWWCTFHQQSVQAVEFMWSLQKNT